MWRNFLTPTLLLSLIGLMFKNNSDMNKKVSRVYTRLDENKEKSEHTYTSKEMCNFKYGTVAADISDIKKELKAVGEIKQTTNLILEKMKDKS